MTDDFSTYSPTLTGPATCAVDVTPSAVDITVTRGIYIGGAGNLQVQMADGGSLIFYGVTAGTVYPIRAEQIIDTSTTATSIIALY